MSSMIVSAQQVQHGYVKTRGKMIDGKVIKGKRVSNVVIDIDGVPTLISSNTGEFSFLVRNNSFSIRNVRKSGYSLVDNKILKQEFNYSSSPLVIVIEDNSDLTQEKIRITRQIRLSLQRELEEKENSLEELRNHNKITIGEYNSLLKELYEEQTRNEGVIGNIVDYSMGIDYDSLDEFHAQIQEYLHAGNLSKADSIIHNRDLSERFLQLNKMRLELQENVSRIESAINEHLILKKTLAEELKIRSQLYIQENKLDSALICLSNRIELDSTFYEYYLDKAILLRDKFPERTNESEILFAKSINHAIDNSDKYISAIEYGAYYQQIGEFDKAMLQYSNALNYIETEDSISKANVLTKLGIAYNSMRNHEEALSYYQQALSYVTSSQVDYQKRSAELFNNIGVVYENQNKYGRALDAYYKALHIRQGIYVDDPENPDIAMSYSNIAGVYDNIEAWDQAIKYYKKSIEIYKSNKGNPELAYVYNNISSCYYNADNLSLALTNSVIACKEIIKYYPDNHPVSLSIQNNLLTLESEIQDFEMILNLDQEDMIEAYLGLSDIFLRYNNITKAIEYNNKIIFYIESLQNMENGMSSKTLLAGVYCNSAYCHILIQKFDEAEMLLKKGNDILEEIYSINTDEYYANKISYYNNSVMLYLYSGKIDKTISICKEGVKYAKELADMRPTTLNFMIYAEQINNLGYLCFIYGDDKTAEESYRYCIEIAKPFVEKNPFKHLSVLCLAQINLGMLMLKQGRLDEFLAMQESYWDSTRKVYGWIGAIFKTSYAVAWDNKGYYALMKGDTEGALSIWKSIIEMEPDYIIYNPISLLYSGLKAKELVE